MTEKELLNQELLETEAQAEPEENPLEKLSIQELEILLVDAEQTIKVTKKQLKDNARIEELGSQIKAHRNDPKWAGHKEKLEAIKEKAEELKVEKGEINAEIDEEVSEQIAEKSQLEAPYKDIIKVQNETIKQALSAMEAKGRVVQTTEE
jgi:hypothetical protein